MLDHVQGLRTELDRVRSVIGDLDAPVPTCPDWRVRDLIHHLGSVYRTFRRVADEGWMHRPPTPAVDDRPPAEDDRILAWTEHQSEELLRALMELDPEAPRWNFSRGPQVGAFIPRRMHHETVVHRWDLAGASGQPGSIDDEVAVDGILEYLEVYVPRSGRWTGGSGVIHTVVADGPTFELALHPGELPIVRPRATEQHDAVVTGSAESLLLAWWGRMPLSARLADGDPTLVADVRRLARA